jgi:hypothetical protein
MLSAEQMHALGMLPLTELRLNSYTYSQQPAINRASQSHLDNDGVRALVDSICHRINSRPGEPPLSCPLAPCSSCAAPRALAPVTWPQGICFSQWDMLGTSKVLCLDHCHLTSLSKAVPCRAEEEPKPFKLSLCGAIALTHDAVSALLRLPLLSELNIDGCYRINSMDKMRLVAKVKAGASLGGTSLVPGQALYSGKDQRAFASHLQRLLRSVT